MTTADQWSGTVGDVWADEWRRTDRSFADLSHRLEAAIADAIPPGATRALDVGCGAGSTSLALAAMRADLSVTGVDVSSALVAAAVSRAAVASVPNARFLTGDVAEGVPAEAAPADLLVSRHGLMFFADPALAFARLRAAAKPGAPLVFTCFARRPANIWASTLVEEVTGAAPHPDDGYAPGPFGFADPTIPAGFLTEAGWQSAEPEQVEFTYLAGEGADPVVDAASFFARIGPLASALRDATDRPALDARLHAVLERYRTGDTIAFPAAAWLWRARA